jgi:hypothetical protein
LRGNRRLDACNEAIFLVDGYEQTMLVTSRPCNVLQRIGQLKELRSTANIPLEQDYSTNFVGCNEGFDIVVWHVTIEADDEELLRLA